MTVIPAELIKFPRLSESVARLNVMANAPIQHFQEIHDALVEYLEGS